jgi:DMSO/TMAO reductase YedYZ molybdopterin-dependent catalytic subunit
MARRPPIVGRFTAEELNLAARNRGMPLEALRYDVTPPGLHYLLAHFDIPHVDERAWRLKVYGRVTTPFEIDLQDLKTLPARTLRVTLECAGNGRGQLSPRYPSVPWIEEGVSTAEWTGVPLAALLHRAVLDRHAVDVVFRGADRGVQGGVEHEFARSLAPAQALSEDILVAYAMNGAALPPQHGAPARLVVPGWYGMASVKWLRDIEVIDARFDGYQQARSYHFLREPDGRGEPCTLMRVNSVMAPPGMREFYTGERLVQAGRVEITGRAWSGCGAIARVELRVDDEWREAHVDAAHGGFAWQSWRATWQAIPGEHELACRATDVTGNLQPLEPPWDLSGFGNNGVHRIHVTVRE